MKLLDIRKLCEQKMLELGADSFWYWDVGAFVFAGDETTVSVSGKQYVTSDEYYGAAEPPVRCGESHLSGLTEPLHFVY